VGRSSDRDVLLAMWNAARSLELLSEVMASHDPQRGDMWRVLAEGMRELRERLDRMLRVGGAR